jgi:hypothetical protein
MIPVPNDYKSPMRQWYRIKTKSKDDKISTSLVFARCEDEAVCGRPDQLKQLLECVIVNEEDAQSLPRWWYIRIERAGVETAELVPASTEENARRNRSNKYAKILECRLATPEEIAVPLRSVPFVRQAEQSQSVLEQ